VAASAVAVGWSSYFNSILSQFGVPLPQQWVMSPLAVQADGSMALSGSFANLPAAILTLLFSFIVAGTVKGYARANGVVVAVKLSVIVLVVLVGAFYIEIDNWAPFLPANQGTWGYFGFSGLLSAAAISFFAYTGFEAIANAAQEARNPQRVMPRALFLAVLVCMTLYVSMVLVMTGLVKYPHLNVPSPVATAVSAIGLDWLLTVVNVGAVIGLTSAVMVSLYGQTRILYAMSGDGIAPRLFRHVDPKRRSPLWGTLVLGAIAALIAGAFPLDILGELISMGALITFATVCLAVPVLRKKMEHAPRGFTVPASPYVPCLGAATCIGLMLGLPLATWRNLVVWLAIGAVMYVIWRRPGQDMPEEVVDGGPSTLSSMD
jgi:APA family basic amino acid/polyamine antiporter